jgi:hypothetical protein
MGNFLTRLRARILPNNTRISMREWNAVHKPESKEPFTGSFLFGQRRRRVADV